MSEYSESEHNSELMYQLDDKPSFWPASFAALQHLLASIVAIVTPTLIVAGTLDLGEYVPYLISCALISSGIGTYIQCKKIGPIGAGMLSLQGTSFAFLTAIIAAGLIVKGRGGSSEDILATIFGVSFCAAFIEVILSRFIHKLKRIFTPVVTGTIIILIGIPLIEVAMTDIAGGYGASDFGSLQNLLLGMIVLVSVIVFNRSKNPLLRLSSIVIALIFGMIAAFFMGRLDFSALNNVGFITIPIPFKFGFQFDFAAFIPLVILYCVSALETTGDLTANSVISKQPVNGPIYLNRIQGGVLADGVNSMIAAALNSMPSTTFSQNNGVIALTGVASRHVGIYIATFMIVIGLFPIFGAILQTMPQPVLGGATLVMFGTVAVAGIKVLASAKLDRRDMLIIATSVGIGIGVSMVPEVLSQLPEAVRNVLISPVAIGAITAIILSLFLPEEGQNAQDL